MLARSRKDGVAARTTCSCPKGRNDPGELPGHQGEVPSVGAARGADVHLVERDHLRPERHRLEVEAAAVRQQARHPREDAAIDLVLTPGAVVLGRAKVLEGAEARDGVERAEGLGGHLARVVDVNLEAVSPACPRLGGRQRDANPSSAPPADEGKQRPPSASQVEQAPARSDPDLVGHVFVLAPLRLFEAQIEVPVVLGAAEVRQLAQAEPENAIDQRVVELEILAVGHRLGQSVLAACHCGQPRGRVALPFEELAERPEAGPDDGADTGGAALDRSR